MALGVCCVGGSGETGVCACCTLRACLGYGHASRLVCHRSELIADRPKNDTVLRSAASPNPRAQRLALCRNALFHEAQRLQLPANGAILSLDLDCTHPPADELAEALRYMFWSPGRAWDALTANSSPRYRDRWALRSRTLGVDYDCWKDSRRVARSGSCFDHSIVIDPAAPPFAGTLGRGRNARVRGELLPTPLASVRHRPPHSAPADVLCPVLDCRPQPLTP